MRRAFFCFLLAAFPAIPAGGEEAQAGIPVRGFVVSGGEKVAGATLRLAAAPSPEQRFEMAFSHVSLEEIARTRSGGDGYFELAAPEVGFYQLQVEADGYLGTDRWVPVLGAATDPIPVELIRGRRVRLNVADPDGRPVAEARLRLGFDKDGAGRYPTWPLFRSTEADGSLSILVPEGQDAAAVLTAPGFAVTLVRLPASQETVDARLDRGSPVTLEVVDPHRRFLPDVAIFGPETLQEIGRTGRDGRAVVRVAAGQRSLGFADAEGRYTIEALPSALPKAAPAGAPPTVSETPTTEASGPLLRIVLEDRPPIEGQVFELPDRVPLAGAWLSLSGRPPYFTRSDRNGFFRLPRVPGRRQVLAAKEGYRSSYAEVGELSLLLGIALEPAATVFGSVTDAAGQPVAGATVTASIESLSWHAESRSRTLTDREGRYSIGDLPAGEVAHLEATYDQLTAKVTVEPVAAGDRARADLRLPRRERWRCRVIDPADKPIAGAEVFVVPPATAGRRPPLLDLSTLERFGRVRRLGRTDAEGQLAITELAAGRYDVAATAAGFAVAWQRDIEIGAAGIAEGAGDDAADAAGPSQDDAGSAAPSDATIVLQPLVRAFGKVLDENGSGLAGATLHVLTADEAGAYFHAGPESPPVATSGEGGEFSFAEVPAGQPFSLAASKEDYVSSRLTDLVLLAGEEQAPLELRLQRAGQIEGTVFGDGEPIPFASLRAEPLDPPQREDLNWEPQARSDAEGGYAIDRLWPGRYRLHAQSRGFQLFQSDVFELRAGERKRLDVELLEAALVVGKVLLPSGEPVADAWVTLAENSAAREFSRPLLPTDALGQYRIESARPGAGWLQVTSDRYRQQGRAVDVGPGVNEINFVLEPGSLEIAGRVLDDNGQPVPGARVRLQGDSIFRQERSGPEGEVRFADLDASIYRVEIDAGGYLLEVSSLELTSSKKDEVWRLREAHSRISGSIFGLEPSSMLGVRIRVRPAVGGDFTAELDSTTVPDSRGRFSIENLAAGTWLMIAWLPGPDRIVTQLVEIGEGQEEVEQDLDFGRLAGPWVGHLQAAGEPQAGFFFALSHPQLGELIQGTRTGARLELQAEAGTYELEIYGAGTPKTQTLEIEIGAPVEQPVELLPPP